MAKSFTGINKGLGLYDIIQFGKYKGCRVDSIVVQDRRYIDYTKTTFGTLWAKEVYNAVMLKDAEEEVRDKRQRNAYSKHGIDALFNDYRDNALYDLEDMFDDVPF